MDDSEVAAAIAAGDPAGLTAAYDRYAARLYGYCRWMLPGPAQAAEALLGTFVTAAATVGDLKDASQMRAWLYAGARDACLGLIGTEGASFDEIADEADPPADARLAEMRRLIRATLADFDPLEHEVIELSIRHHLDEAELAAVLEISWSRAHAVASRAREHLAKILGALLIADAGRRSCPELAALLAGWDGRLTVETGKLTARHIEQCDRCAHRRVGTLRPEMVSGLLPLAPLPSRLRELILRQAAARQDEGPAGPRWSAGLRQAGTVLRWSRIRDNPGPATAAAAVTMWAVAALSATLITITGMHAVHALAAQSSPAAPAVSAPAGRGDASASTGRVRSRPSRPARQARPGLAPRITPSSYVSAPALPAEPAVPAPSRPAAPSAPASSSPKRSASSSPSPSRSHTPKPTPAPTPSPSSSPRPTST